MVAAAIIGSAVVGGIASSSASKSASDASGRASASAERSASNATALGYEELDFTKKQYSDAEPYRVAAAKTAQEIAEQQLAASKTNDALAADYANYNKTTFRPLEQGIVADAKNYDTPEKRQAAADSAMADTNMAFSKSNEATARTMAANGINPGSTRAMSVQAGQGVDQAVANAGASYKARKGVETVGHAMQMDAASLGRNLPSSQATSAQVALTAGNSAVNNSVNGLNAVNSGVGVVQAGYNAASNAQLGAAGVYNQVANAANAAGNSSSALWGTLGQVAGSYAGSTAGSNQIASWSDETLKTDIKKTDPQEALDEVVNTPVSNWKYSPNKMAERGIPMEPGMEGAHTGPMAQDVNATMGDKAAPDGKKLDLITMNGKSMLAIQALDKKVSKLASMIHAGKVQAKGKV